MFSYTLKTKKVLSCKNTSNEKVNIYTIYNAGIVTYFRQNQHFKLNE